MRFKDIYIQSPRLFDNGLKQMEPNNKLALLEHLIRHKEANKDLFWTIDMSELEINRISTRIVDNVLALLEHRQFQLNYQLSNISKLTLEYSHENQSYSTNSLNDANISGYSPLDNVAGQSFGRQKLSDNESYINSYTIIELELEDVYKYLRSCQAYGTGEDIEYVVPQEIVLSFSNDEIYLANGGNGVASANGFLRELSYWSDTRIISKVVFDVVKNYALGPSNPLVMFYSSNNAKFHLTELDLPDVYRYLMDCYRDDALVSVQIGFTPSKTDMYLSGGSSSTAIGLTAGQRVVGYRRRVL